MPDEKGFLTETDKEFLRGEREYSGENSKQMRYQRRRAVRERTREALRDFGLLNRTLDETERDKIFAAEPRSRELKDLQGDVREVIQFLYTGLGGEAGFRQPLQTGVANGEVMLGNTDNFLERAPRFEVNTVAQQDRGELIAAVEREEWSRLDAPGLFTFVELAVDAGAIDFDGIRDKLEEREWFAEITGGKSRNIPGGKKTPTMPSDVYEEQNIGELSGEELRKMFGDGHPAPWGVIYDGEKVATSPPPWTDEQEPEVLYYVDPEEGKISPDDVDE